MTFSDDLQDCVIIGGGPAGLTAGLYLGRFLRRVTVFDAGGGRARMIPATHNLGPFPDGISGRDLLARMRTSAGHYGARIEDARVMSIDRHGNAFRIGTNRGPVTTRNLIFATGVTNHPPPMSEQDHGTGVSHGLIRYCPVCDAYEARDKRIAVLGSGKNAVGEARFLRDYSTQVTLIAPPGHAAKSERGIISPDAPMDCLGLSDAKVVVTLATKATLLFDTLYVALGTTAHSDLAASIGVRLGPAGHIRVEEKQRTNVSGVYAIGDVTDGLDQIAVAMGQAAIAATAIHNTLD